MRSYDFKSSRYLDHSQKLVVPLSILHLNDTIFDGFVVYDIRLDDISRSYEIPHHNPYDLYSRGCYDAEYDMPGRSFVFDSN